MLGLPQDFQSVDLNISIVNFSENLLLDFSNPPFAGFGVFPKNFIFGFDPVLDDFVLLR